MSKSIYELACEEFKRQSEVELPTISVERIRELLAEGKKVRKNIQDRFKPLTSARRRNRPYRRKRRDIRLD